MANQFLTRYIDMFREKAWKRPEIKSSVLTNYNEYKPASKENLVFIGLAAFAFFAMGMLFYRSYIVALICCVFVVPARKIYIKFKIDKRKEKLMEGFKDVLYSISGAIAAGRQMPQAIHDASVQMRNAYGDSDITSELKHIDNVYLHTHADIGELLLDFANRSGLEEIKQFADSYRVCKKCGADLEAVCLKSASLLLDKIDYQNEVKSLISQKKLDIILLTGMPIVVLMFLNLASYNYIAILYESLVGRMIMSLCLAMIIGALVWGLKITDLKL